MKINNMKIGNWEVEGQGQEITGVLDTGHNHYICKLSGWAQPMQDGLAQAISALPELLDSLEAMVEVFANPNTETLHEVIAARAAIKKAKGE